MLGADYNSDRGVIDVTIYGNGIGGTITARGNDGPDNRKVLFYKDSDNNIYAKFVTGLSVTFMCIGNYPSPTTLPSGATQLTVTPYS